MFCDFLQQYSRAKENRLMGGSGLRTGCSAVPASQQKGVVSNNESILQVSFKPGGLGAFSWGLNLVRLKMGGVKV